MISGVFDNKWSTIKNFLPTFGNIYYNILLNKKAIQILYIKAQVVERIHVIKKKNIIIIYCLFMENSLEKRFVL